MPVLVGREPELAQLDGLIAEAARGHGRLAVIRGEAGIGKSRLVREALGRWERARFATSMDPFARTDDHFTLGLASALGSDAYKTQVPTSSWQ